MAKEAWLAKPSEIGHGTGREVQLAPRFPRFNKFLGMAISPFLEPMIRAYGKVVANQHLPLSNSENTDLIDLDPGELNYEKACQFAMYYSQHYIDRARTSGFVKLRTFEKSSYIEAVRIKAFLEKGDLRSLAKFYLTKATLQYKNAEVFARLEKLEVTEYAKRKYSNKYEYREKHVTREQFLENMDGRIPPELDGSPPDLILPADNFVMSLRMAAVFAREVSGK